MISTDCCWSKTARRIVGVNAKHHIYERSCGYTLQRGTYYLATIYQLAESSPDKAAERSCMMESSVCATAHSVQRRYSNAMQTAPTSSLQKTLQTSPISKAFPAVALALALPVRHPLPRAQVCFLSPC